MYHNIAWTSLTIRANSTTQWKTHKHDQVDNINSFNSERELRSILNEPDNNKQLSTKCCVNVGPASQTVDEH